MSVPLGFSNQNQLDPSIPPSISHVVPPSTTPPIAARIQSSSAPFISKGKLIPIQSAFRSLIQEPLFKKGAVIKATGAYRDPQSLSWTMAKIGALLGTIYNTHITTTEDREKIEELSHEVDELKVTLKTQANLTPDEQAYNEKCFSLAKEAFAELALLHDSLKEAFSVETQWEKSTYPLTESVAFPLFPGECLLAASSIKQGIEAAAELQEEIDHLSPGSAARTSLESARDDLSSRFLEEYQRWGTAVIQTIREETQLLLAELENCKDENGELELQQKHKGEILQQLVALRDQQKKLESELHQFARTNTKGMLPLQSLLLKTADAIQSETALLNQILDSEKDIPLLKSIEYGKTDWLDLVAKRPVKEPSFFEKITQMLTFSPETWSDSKKAVVEKLLIGLQLSQYVIGIEAQISQTLIWREQAAQRLANEIKASFDQFASPELKENINESSRRLGLLLSDKYQALRKDPNLVNTFSKKDPLLREALEKILVKFGDQKPTREQIFEEMEAFEMSRYATFYGDLKASQPNAQHPLSFSDWWTLFSQSEVPTEEQASVEKPPIEQGLLEAHVFDTSPAIKPISWASKIVSSLGKMLSLTQAPQESSIFVSSKSSLLELQLQNSINQLMQLQAKLSQDPSLQESHAIQELREEIMVLYRETLLTLQNKPKDTDSLSTLAIWAQEVSDKNYAIELLKNRILLHPGDNVLKAQQKAAAISGLTNEELKEYLSQSHGIFVTKEIFSRLFPKNFIEAAAGPGKMGQPELWDDSHFDKEILDKLLTALEEGRVQSIESDEGVFTKLSYDSNFHAELHKKSLDYDKSTIIAKSFKNHLNHLPKKDKIKLKKTLAKYIDYVGVDQSNIKKILKKSESTSSIFISEEGKECLNKFLDEITTGIRQIVSQRVQMGEQERLAEGAPLIGEDTVAITTTSSGGAHLSIASVLQTNLAKRNIPHAIINESHLVKKDNLQRFTKLHRNEVFNKVSQQSQQMTYGKKLKKLDDYLNQFYPDESSDVFRGAVGNATYVLSTSHHPDNVRVVAEHGKTIYFQVCDFGHLSEKLHEVARVVAKYSLSNIFFFTPSERSTLQLTEKAPQGLPPAAPNTNASALALPPELEKYKERYENYQRVSLLTQYPIHEAFTREISKAEIEQFKEKYQLRQEAKLWAMTMGSQGVGGILFKYIDQVIRGAIKEIQTGKSVELEKGLDVIILCGANQALHKELNEYYDRAMVENCQGDAQLLVQLREYVHFTSMPKLKLEEMAIVGKASDAFLSKPGGGTTAEVLLGEFPMLIHREEKHFWEFGNIEELLAAGAEEIHHDFYEKAKKANRVKVHSSRARETPYNFIASLWKKTFRI